MSTSNKDSNNNTTWKDNISKRIRRIEIYFFIITIASIAFLSHVIASSQRELQAALSSILSMQRTISSLSNTQTTLVGQIESMNDKINKFEQNQMEIEFTKLSQPIHHNANVTSKDPSDTRFLQPKVQPIKNVKTIPKSPPQTVSRKTMSLSNFTNDSNSCNGTLFRLELQLDEWAEETSFILTSLETGNIIKNESFSEADSLKNITFEACLEDRHYKFILRDSFGDGIQCFHSFDGLPCYDIYINDILSIPGSPFQNSLQSHEFNLNSLCLIGNIVIYELNFYFERIQAEGILFIHKMTNTQTKEELEISMVPENDNKNNKTSFFQCLDPAIYDVEFFSPSNRDIICNGPCYIVSVNDEIVIEGQNFFRSANHRFFVTIDGIGREQKCNSNLLLAPINELNQFSFDNRVSEILNVIRALSNVQDIFNINSIQHQAACYILHDDPLQLQVEDPRLMQRYALAVFLYSTNEMAEVQLALDVCLDDKFQCNDNDDVISVDWSGGGLNGSIPTELGHLRHLKTLSLFSKSLKGKIPTEIKRLANLTIIKLANNDLTGTIPTILGTFALQILDVGENRLTGSIPTELGASETLTNIRLYNNLLTGTIPLEIFNSSSLEELDLEDNLLNGSIPDEIGKVNKLEYFSVLSNELTGTIPPGLGQAILLGWLDLGKNGLTGTIPTELEQITIQLERFALNDNFLTGTVPNINSTDKIYLQNNSLTGTIPESILNLRISGLKLEDNNLVGEITQAFCDNLTPLAITDGAYDLSVDHSIWFLDEPLVACPCCSDVICHMWKNNEVLMVGGTRKPSCPKSNVFQRDIFERVLIRDDVANVTYFEELGWGIEGELDLCLSPTGCFSLKYDIVNGRDDREQSWDKEYKLSFSLASQTLEEQDTCDAIEICGISFSSDHLKRVGLNHLTLTILSDLSILDDPSLPEYKALCWIMTQDSMFHDFHVCDGTLLQRYVMVFFYYSFQRSLGFDVLNSIHTCEWPGVTCDSLNKYIEHLDFSDRGMEGSFITEIGLLTRLKTLILSHNSLVDSIDASAFDYLPFLEVVDISFNKFDGLIPKTLLQLPQLKELVLSNNFFAGGLPQDIEYSESIKTFDVENNLLVSFIPDALIFCPRLEVLNLSRNNFQGGIPSAIGLLKHIREIQFHQNNLSGTLPTEIFNLKQIERFELQSNSLIGTIPTHIGNWKSAKFISLSHNILKGVIPKELESLNKIEYIHLHNNFLTGTAPYIPKLKHLGESSGELERYITDCGDPSYSLAKPLSCSSCTLCCNSDGLCQKNRSWPFTIQKGAFIVMFGVPIALCFSFCSIFHGMKFWNARIKQILDERSELTMIDEDSTYCLIFSNSYGAWMIYLIVYLVQGCFYYLFLQASFFSSKASDWQFTFQCSSSSIWCVNSSNVDIFGWIMFFVVTLVTLSVDFINSTLLILKSVVTVSLRMLISGIFHLGMTVLALFCSFYYNLALATTNTELIVNAIILLFINDLDEQIMNAIHALFPDWVDRRIKEIKQCLTVGEKNTVETDALSSSQNTVPELSLSQNNPIEKFAPAIELIYTRNSKHATKI